MLTELQITLTDNTPRQKPSFVQSSLAIYTVSQATIQTEAGTH